MILARVVGRLYSTIHHPSMGHKTILMLDRLKANGEPSGGSILAVDTVGAGAGQTVLVLDEGNGARQILGEADAPIRSVVVGIVDEIALSGAEQCDVRATVGLRIRGKGSGAGPSRGDESRDMSTASQ
jgi:microcompartment protein CcmK/EutM